MAEREHQKTKGISAAIKRWAPLIVILGLMAGAYITGLHEHVNLESFHAQKDQLLAQVAEAPIISALIFLALYAGSVALSLPIATLLTLAGGFLFGKWIGTLLVVGAATLGASIIFMIAKTSLGETLREKAGGLYARIESNMKDNAVGYLLFMRLVPLFPFVLVNIVPALFNVSLRVFVLTTFVGIIPGSFVFVNVGERLGEIESLSDLVSTETLLAFGLLGLFALIPTLYKQFKNKGASAHG
ncbi:MAG: TVP38/TMEM64 family protein [Pseudomonadota bacterium]